jgi:hypothetical protein
VWAGARNAQRATTYIMEGLIHALLVVAIVVVLIRVISGRKPI